MTVSLPTYNRPRRIDLLREFQELLQKVGLPSIEARWILTFASRIDDKTFVTKLLEPVPPDIEEAARAVLELRMTGHPLQLLIGETEFFGLKLRVKRGILIPRPETEGLVEIALQLPRAPSSALFNGPESTERIGAKVLDVGTGTGAIALAYKSMRPNASVWATDINPEAIKLATENAHNLGLEVYLREATFTGNLGNFDLVISNPPYLPEGYRKEAPPELTHEDDTALYSGKDGLKMPRELIRHAWDALKPGGWMALELDPSNIYLLLAEAAEQGWKNLQTRRDLAQRPRYLVGQRPLPPVAPEDDGELIVEHDFWYGS